MRHIQDQVRNNLQWINSLLEMQILEGTETVPTEEIRRRIGHADWYMTAEEALEASAIDGIVV